MPSPLFFPDTTVISNFALIGHMPLLAIIVNGNGAWCATVASECAVGASKPGLSGMAQAGPIFGAPIFPTPAEHVDILLLQDQMRQPGDGDAAHLGEAETLTIITNRQLTAGFVTDDAGARREATARGIKTYNTWHILKLAVRAVKLSVADFHSAYDTLVAANRGHPPCARDRSSVEAWLAT